MSIHTVTAFIYNGMVARPYWNASILAPEFLASAFCSGPAVLLILLQVLRRTTRLKIQDAAIWKIAELMAYAMAVNPLPHRRGDLQGVLFRQRAPGLHAVLLYRHRRAPGDCAVSPGCRSIFDFVAFLLFLIPRARRTFCCSTSAACSSTPGVYIEKGIGLLIPGFTPDTLGEIYRVHPVVHRSPDQPPESSPSGSCFILSC